VAMPCKSFSSLEATTNDAAIAVGANAKAAPFESCAKAVCDASHGSSIRGMDTSLEPRSFARSVCAISMNANSAFYQTDQC